MIRSRYLCFDDPIHQLTLGHHQATGYSIMKPKESQLPCGTMNEIVRSITAIRTQGCDFFAEADINNATQLMDVYPWGLPASQVHFLIKSLTPEDTHTSLPTEPELTARRANYFRKNVPKAPSSDTTKPQPSNLLLYGRPVEHIIPPSLLDETLAQFRHDAWNITPESLDRNFFHRLRKAMILSYPDEQTRKVELSSLINEILPRTLAEGTIDISPFETDGQLIDDVLVRFFIQNVKNEVGVGGEPHVKVSKHYLEQCRRLCEENSVVASRPNFPAILLCQFGAFLSVSAAVMLDIPIVELIACIPLQAHSTHSDQLQAGERVVAALRVACHDLKIRYAKLFAKSNTQIEYPFPRHYDSLDLLRPSPVPFTYLSSLPDNRVYRAKDDYGTALYIKYATRYSQDAHIAASRLNIAPRLIGFKSVYAWSMVVMEDLSEEYTTLATLKTEGTPDLPKILEDTRQALRQLHASGFVHGDVRDINLLVHKSTSKIMLVDWDWAGACGSVWYPSTINPDVLRPPRAVGCAEILPEDALPWLIY
ncbi:hypothetical protein B0H12DRAFT_716442 [Mycena haematopus]|nr:hypothetical protein B0H12DRAFT_716442 [Mycena haematopus]